MRWERVKGGKLCRNEWREFPRRGFTTKKRRERSTTFCFSRPFQTRSQYNARKFPSFRVSTNFSFSLFFDVTSIYTKYSVGISAIMKLVYEKTFVCVQRGPKSQSHSVPSNTTKEQRNTLCIKSLFNLLTKPRTPLETRRKTFLETIFAPAKLQTSERTNEKKKLGDEAQKVRGSLHLATPRSSLNSIKPPSTSR